MFHLIQQDQTESTHQNTILENDNNLSNLDSWKYCENKTHINFFFFFFFSKELNFEQNNKYPWIIYLNRVKIKKQFHSFLRKSIKIEVDLTRNKRLERVESGLDKSEAFEVSKGSWFTNKENAEMVWIIHFNKWSIVLIWNTLWSNSKDGIIYHS